jgi:hypothetical protein
MRRVLILGFVAVIGGCGVATVEEELDADGRTVYRATEIEPFTTDGCSDFFDGVPMAEVKIWRHCCVIHDLRYWMGGMEGDKRTADLRLASCVNEAAGEHIIDVGNWMYYAVNLFGGPTWGPVANVASWRWAYGWPVEESSYAELAPEQIKSIQRELGKVRDSLRHNLDPAELPLTEEQRRQVIEAIDSLFTTIGPRIGPQP